VSTLAGGGGSTTSGYVDGVGTVAKFSYPYGVSVSSIGNVYVSDNNNNLIRMINTAGAFCEVLVWRVS
jgi:DNA-binding beta-propeller fold protein YncE